MKSIDYWIKHLDLIAHTEGGYFKEIYRSDEVINKSALPERFPGDRVYYTSIYYLLVKNDPSKFHKVKADELWHFLDGTAIKMHFINEQGEYSTVKVGLDIENDEHPSYMVPHNTWMAAEVIEDDSFSLVACTTAPGFEYDDFQMANKDELIKLCSDAESIITKFV